MESLKQFKARLALLDNMLSRMKTSHSRMQQLKRSVYILKLLLNDQEKIKSPYGPATPIVPFSLQ
jgi:hypothetical protein